ncbi:MAG: hypothetical protein ACTTJS_02820 [Wolinella sp.]
MNTNVLTGAKPITIDIEDYKRRLAEHQKEIDKENEIREAKIAQGIEFPDSIELDEKEVKFAKFFQAYDKHLNSLKSGGSLRNFLKTGDSFSFGHLKDAKIYLDLNNDGKIRESEKIRIEDLSALDSNNDGVLDTKDKLFSKLKVEFSDSSKETHVANLSTVVNSVNLEDFFDPNRLDDARNEIERQRNLIKDAKKTGKAETDGKNGKNYQKIHHHEGFFEETTRWEDERKPGVFEYPKGAYDSRRAVKGLNPYLKLSNEVTFKKADDGKIERLLHENGIKAGDWLEIRGRERLGITSEIFNLGYKKIDASGKEYIQAFNTEKRFDDPLFEGRTYKLHNGRIATHEIDGNEQENFYQSWINDPNRKSHKDKLKEEFEAWDATYKENETKRHAENTKLYNEMKVAGLDSESLALIADFGDTNFPPKEAFKSITGMEFSKENLEAAREMVARDTFENKFGDLDVVQAIKQNEDGTFMLKYDSGRVVRVKDLYYQDEESMQIEKRTSINIAGLNGVLNGGSLNSFRA